MAATILDLQRRREGISHAGQQLDPCLPCGRSCRARPSRPLRRIVLLDG
jgi:hypothetical protein